MRPGANSHTLSPMAKFTMEQMLFAGGRCVARSARATEADADAAESLLRQLSPPPGDVLAVAPVGRWIGVLELRRHQARVLLVPPRLYRWMADPFHLARSVPLDFTAADPLQSPPVDFPAPPPRTLKAVQRHLRRPDAPTLLGATQAILDGGRVVFVRPGPDATAIEDVWFLLPDADRAERTFTTWAPGPPDGFDLVVAPRADGPEFEPYLKEAEAGDYPEGRYELALQLAAETDDADGLDRLFARRSMSQSLRLALTLLVTGVIAALAVRHIPWHRLG